MLDGVDRIERMTASNLPARFVSVPITSARPPNPNLSELADRRGSGPLLET